MVRRIFQLLLVFNVVEWQHTCGPGRLNGNKGYDEGENQREKRGHDGYVELSGSDCAAYDDDRGEAGCPHPGGDLCHLHPVVIPIFVLAIDFVRA